MARSWSLAMRSGRRKSYGWARLAGSSSCGESRRFRKTSSISSWDRTRSGICVSIGAGPVSCTLVTIKAVPRFHVHNFGCRASQADGAAIEAALLNRGFQATSNSGEAELVVLNSCTVTAFADEDVRKTVRRVHRENPDARILVTGCYAQRAPQEIAVLPGVAWVVGNS